MADSGSLHSKRKLAVNRKESEEEEEEEAIYGPTLPSNIKKMREAQNSTHSHTSTVYGPTLLSSLEMSAKRHDIQPSFSNYNPEINKVRISNDIVGPQPIVKGPTLQNAEEEDESAVYGPKLPSEMKINQQNESNDKPIKVYGPTLPPSVQKSLKECMAEPSFPNQDVEIDKEEDTFDDYIGPQPIGKEMTPNQLKLEERALELRLTNFESKEGCSEKPPSREEWMLKLPEINSLSKLEPSNRRFRQKEGPDFKNRSEWTKSPLNKSGESVENTEQQQEDINMKEQMLKDYEQERLFNKHGKKQKDKKSLVDIHRSKMKSKEKEKSGKSERRRFNREIDLQLNRLNQAGINSVIEKAKVLDTKFSAGKAKYL